MPNKANLILAGGGHAQLAVLQALAREPLPGFSIRLITPEPVQRYSGMLPGWIAGHYQSAQCCIDLRPLAKRAGVSLQLDSVTWLDADTRQLGLASGEVLSYQWLSLDIGSGCSLQGLESLGERLLPVRPLAGFFPAWQALLAEQQAQSGEQIVVLGGGAAGVELAFGMRQALPEAELILIAPALLPGHASGVVRRVARALQARGIRWLPMRASAQGDQLLLEDGRLLNPCKVIAATGAQAPACLQGSGLRLDAQGFVAVNALHQSVSHPTVFAAGDVCSRSDVVMARSGVHAVHAGPVLAHNLLASLHGRPLRPYLPRRHSLYLLATGDARAIASWGALSAEGAWVWRWKDRIDRNFIRRHMRG